MGGKCKLIYSDLMQNYCFGPDHPFNPFRLVVTLDLMHSMGLLQDGDLVEPNLAEIEHLQSVHHQSYLDVFKRASRGEATPAELHTCGMDSEDTPAFVGMDEAARCIVGSALQGAKMIMEGQADHVFAIGGGLHHAHSNRASGFCLLNDAAVAIAYVQKHFGARVAYVDTDAHHGDGVQSIFYDTPQVLTVSIHETGKFLFPGTGSIEERGRFDGYGFSVNIPLEAYTEDDSFIECYRSSVEPLLEAFQPDLIISQNGCDTHYLDPLTHLAFTTKSLEAVPSLMHEWAHKYANGRLLALGGGGYDIWRVVPRAWTLLWAALTERDMPEKIPDKWRARWQTRSRSPLPVNIRDLDDEYPPIPRRELITDKNRLTLKRAMGGVVDVIKQSRIGF